MNERLESNTAFGKIIKYRIEEPRRASFIQRDIFPFWSQTIKSEEVTLSSDDAAEWDEQPQHNTDSIEDFYYACVRDCGKERCGYDDLCLQSVA